MKNISLNNMMKDYKNGNQIFAVILKPMNEGKSTKNVLNRKISEKLSKNLMTCFQMFYQEDYPQVELKETSRSN